MKSGRQSNILSSKKEQFRKQIRTEQLSKYMRKIRIEMSDSQQFKSLKNVIGQVFSHEFNQNQKGSNAQLQRISDLIRFANNGSTPAIVALAELLLDRAISIEMIQGIRSQQQQNSENSNKAGQKNEIMKVIRFPQTQNQGWLAFIRVLLTLNYCTNDMILYSLKTVAKSNSQKALDLALQIIHYLLIQKKLLSVQQIFKTMLSSNSEPKDQPETNIHTRFIYSVMKLSLDSTFSQQCPDIRYFSTKILCKCFADDRCVDQVILKVIPLQRLVGYFKEKFNTKGRGLWEQTKALRMVNDLLMALTNFNHYQLERVITICFPLVKQIVDYLTKTSYDLYLRNTQSGYLGSNSKSDYIKNYEQDFKFLEEGVFLIQILIDDYLFTHNNISVAIQLLSVLGIENFFIYLHSAYIKEAQKCKKRQGSSGQNDEEGVSLEDMCKSLLVEKIEKLCQLTVDHLTDLSEKLRMQKISCSQEQCQKFMLTRNIIIKRFRESQLRQITEKSIASSGIDLNYI